MDEELPDDLGPSPNPAEEKLQRIGLNEASDRIPNCDPGSSMEQHLKGEPNGKITESEENDSDHGSDRKDVDLKTRHNIRNEDIEQKETSTSSSPNGAESRSEQNEVKFNPGLNKGDSGSGQDDVRPRDNSPSPDYMTTHAAADPGFKQNDESLDVGSNIMDRVLCPLDIEPARKCTSPVADPNNQSGARKNAAIHACGSSGAPAHGKARSALKSTGTDPQSQHIDAHSSESREVNTRSGLKNANHDSGRNDADPMSEQRAGPSGLYRPPSMRACQQKQNAGGPKLSAINSPTHRHFTVEQQNEKKNIKSNKEPFIRRNPHERQTRPNECFNQNSKQRSNQSFNQRSVQNTNPYSNQSSNQRSNESPNQSYDQKSNQWSKQRSDSNRTDYPQKKNQLNTYARLMTCSMLAEISKSESLVIIEKINRQKESFKMLLEETPDKRNQDVFALVFELVTNLWKSSFEESKKLLLLEICNCKFVDHLELYLMQLPYTANRDKLFNKHYWTRENEFWDNFMNFCECIINVSPSTAVRKCGALIEATSQSCLDGLKEKYGYELPAGYMARMTTIRDSVRKQEKTEKKSNTSSLEPPESFRQLSVLPTAVELLCERAFVRPNVVEGGYADVEHYLDVQFRLLREDCFGPLREGIQQYIEDPKKRKYDNIRIYHNVKFQEPHFAKQQIGSLVLLDQNTERMFRNINWKQSKRFMFGSLVLFTKDSCRSFLVGTVMERDEEYLNRRLLGVSILDSAMESDLYNDDLYTMIECEVFFEPYHHVLKALQDPRFPRQLAMSKYIVHVQKVPETPAYLSRDTKYKIRTNEVNKLEFSVLQDETWPSQTQLGLDSTQYEAYKLALTNEFAVIQGPPGTGKTFIGLKIARTLLKNAPITRDTCSMLVICYTNHALDQFLEALLPFTDSIARIGGRSQNEQLEYYNLKKLRGRDYLEEKRWLQECISELKDTHEACVSTDILLSCDTIGACVEECKIIKDFYENLSVDALKYWLLGNVESVELGLVQLFEEHYENEVGVRKKDEIQNNNDVDDDIYAREELDLEDADEVLRISWFTKSRISFSLRNAEYKINDLRITWNRIHTKICELNNILQDYEKGEGLFHNDKNPVDTVKDIKIRIIRLNKELQDTEIKIYPLKSQIQVFKDMMAYQSRAPRINIANVGDISKVPLIERWSLYFEWAKITKNHLKKTIKHMEKNVEYATHAYEEARMIADLRVLRKKHVIGMTTTAAARLRKMIVAMAPPIVIVEEAAEVLEAHIVAALTENCQHLILIGDHQQLRPSASCVRLARHFGLEVSLFERMVRNGVRARRLGVQHRMRPELAALVSPHIYKDLRNHPSVDDFPPVRGVAHNLFFFTHDHREQSQDDSSSRTNTQEADLVLSLANYLMQQGYKPDEVTILAAYSGQLFYMRNQRQRYPYLSKVKITVLDNYQGEESKIILLSLVRNNANNSIGFLGTENRICVALSRAREGFFIFGNIDLLKRNSTLWKKIAETLDSNGSLGSSLKLKCENHDDQMTMISSPKDFEKVPEGGCLLNCNYKIPGCGHPCQRICHIDDMDHDEIICPRKCERKICDIEGHICPYKCGIKCKPCERWVEKVLPCDHTRAVPCHMAPTSPGIYCDVTVNVTLPSCGHETTKPCSMKVRDVKCVVNCENSRLLNCGHTCARTCHVNDDPNHVRYACSMPCTKAKKGCTANLEGDLGAHKCPLECYEKCANCDVKVTKKRSNCTHSKQVACHEDVDSQPCREKCARSLPCGHHCKKLCHEPCGDCRQKVKKTIPECNHEIEIECGTEATREHCRGQCERSMWCGHACRAACARPCDHSACAELTDHTSAAPCGHDVRLPCHMYQAMQKGEAVTQLLLPLCTAPCGVLLQCGHSCGGSCSSCRQGRLHAPCAARCHQLNICGHRCEEPCSQVCPPCRKPCEVRCPHSRCNHLCGAPCTPCKKKCSRACSHSRCTHACGAACSRAACDAACALRLPCGHACRGLCGEPCPRACRDCDPDNFPTDLLGDVYSDDHKLIQLQDCPHIFDVITLDALMKNEDNTIQIKTCPICQVPIINTFRYKDLVSEMLKNEINPIKRMVYGTQQQRSEMRLNLLKKIKQAGETLHLAKNNVHWRQAFNAIQNVVQPKNKSVSALQMDMYHVYVDLLVTVGEYYMKYVTQQLSELNSEIKKQIKLICEAIMNNKHKISQQQLSDIGKELKRMNSMIQLSSILEFSQLAESPEVREAAERAIRAVLTWRVYDEDKGVECLKKFEEAVNFTGTAGKEERTVVVRAIGPKAGHWYKCPGGHFCCVASGGAPLCPECGAAVGKL